MSSKKILFLRWSDIAQGLIRHALADKLAMIPANDVQALLSDFDS